MSWPPKPLFGSIRARLLLLLLGGLGTLMLALFLLLDFSSRPFRPRIAYQLGIASLERSPLPFSAASSLASWRDTVRKRSAATAFQKPSRQS